MNYLFWKRVIDIVLSGIGLLCLWPVLLIIAIVIKLDSRGPVLFKQRRIGKNKSEFLILKFRTMRTDTPKEMPTHLLQNPGAFITKVGRFLRKSSLDELPQLINIFKGEMSVVGPRPALWNQIDLIKKRDNYGANDIRPGLTGWAQINGRDEISNELKAKYDGEYAVKLNLLMDIRCFFETFIKVINRDGVIEGSTGDKKKLSEKQSQG